MEPDYDFDTMTNIGASYNLTCTKLGKILKQVGLRDDDKPSKPTAKAFDIGMVKQRFDLNGHYCWAWHVAKTCKLLEHLGHTRKTASSTDQSNECRG